MRTRSGEGNGSLGHEIQNMQREVTHLKGKKQRLLKDFRKEASAPKLSRESVAKKWKKRLSSEEFLKVQDEIWKPGPPVRYQNPDKWYKKADYPY